MFGKPVLAIVAITSFLFLSGCGYIPILSELGLLPGPPPILMVKVLPREDLAAMLSDYGDIGTQPCPEGQIWIGTITDNGTQLKINGCIDIELATQYAQSFGLL